MHVIMVANSELLILLHVLRGDQEQLEWGCFIDVNNAVRGCRMVDTRGILVDSIKGLMDVDARSIIADLEAVGDVLLQDKILDLGVFIFHVNVIEMLGEFERLVGNHLLDLLDAETAVVCNEPTGEVLGISHSGNGFLFWEWKHPDAGQDLIESLQVIGARIENRGFRNDDSVDRQVHASDNLVLVVLHHLDSIADTVALFKSGVDYEVVSTCSCKWQYGEHTRKVVNKGGQVDVVKVQRVSKSRVTTGNLLGLLFAFGLLFGLGHFTKLVMVVAWNTWKILSTGS